jgi:hypothetical protein
MTINLRPVFLRQAFSFVVGLLVAIPVLAQDGSARRAQMTDVWIRVAPGTDHPDISSITAAGQATMDAYDHATDGILRCLIDWGRVNTVSGFPMELIISEKQVTVLYEYNHAVRRVFLDQTEFSSAYPPSLVGYSIGHWEDDTLVVETRNLLSGWINMDGVAPYTEAAVTTERFTLDPARQRLTVTRTLEDPEYYSAPLTWTTVYRPAEFPVYPYDCTVGSYGSSLEG